MSKDKMANKIANKLEKYDKNFTAENFMKKCKSDKEAFWWYDKIFMGKGQR